MQSDMHERARYLLDRSLVESVAIEEQRWLDNHLLQCAECSRHAELSRRALEALEGFAFDVDPEAAFRVQQNVCARADEMAAARFSIGIPLAIALTVLGSLAMWVVLSQLAPQWNVPAPAWHTAFAALWLLPSVLLDLLLLFRGRLMKGETV